MSFITAPDFLIKAISWTLDRPGQANVSAWTGTRIVVSNPWHGKWTAHVELATQQDESTFRTIRSFFARCRGSLNTFRLYATAGPQNGNTGVTLGANVAAGATTLTISGAVTPLTDGQFFTLNGQLCVCTADQSGATLTFEPALRQAANTGTIVVTSRPYALVYLTSSAFSWQIQSWRQFGLAFDVEEAITEADGVAPEGGLPPTLQALSLSGSLVSGTPSSGTLVGATAGSSYSTTGTLPTGLTIAATGGTYSWAGSPAVGAYSFNIIETNSTATNSPRTSAISGTVTSGNGYDIILMAGDSYTVGVVSRQAGVDTVWPGSYQFHSYASDAAYRTIDSNTVPYSQQIGYDTTNSYLSPGEYLAKAYAARTGRKCLVIPMGYNGTHLVSASGDANANWSVGGLYHENSVAQANAAITAATAAFADSKFVGIFHWLAANDMALSPTPSRSAFASALTSAISDFRSRITGAANSWYAIGGTLPDFLAITPATHQPIEFAEQDVHAAGTNILFVPQSTGYNSGDNLHSSLAGSRYMGGAIDAALADTVAPVINVPSSIPAYEATNFQYLLYQNQQSFGGADKYATWSLSGADAAGFEIAYIIPGYSSGDLRNAYYKVVLRYLNDAVLPAYATKSSYSLTLTAKGSNGKTSSKAITIPILQAYGSVSSGANPITVTHMSSQDTTLNQDLLALPTQAFGAGLNLVYMHANGNAPAPFTSLTVNGVHATLVKASSAGDCSQVWSVPIATAGNYSPVIVTTGDTPGSIEVVCLTNTVATPAATDSLDYANRASPIAGASLTCPTNGIIVGIGTSGTAITSPGSGTVLVTSNADGTFAATRNSTGAISLNASSGYCALISMAFAKA